VYYKVCYDLVMLFGGTEIEIQVCWKENVRSSIFEICLLCCVDVSYLFRVSRKGNGFFFLLLFSPIDLLITLVGSMQEPR
jgi:hypothetical protein